MLEHYWANIRAFPEAYVPDLFLLIAVVTGLVNVHYLNGAFRWLLCLVLITSGIEAMMLHYAAFNVNNHYLINLTSPVEIICLAFVYGIEIRNNRSRRVIVLFVGLYLIALVYNSEWQYIARYMIGIQRLVLMFFVILHFQHLLSGMRVPNLLVHAMFWVSAGVMLYAAGTFFIFLFGTFTFKTPKLTGDFIWYLNLVRFFTCIFYALLAFGFYLYGREVRPIKRLTT